MTKKPKLVYLSSHDTTTSETEPPDDYPEVQSVVVHQRRFQEESFAEWFEEVGLTPPGHVRYAVRLVNGAGEVMRLTDVLWMEVGYIDAIEEWDELPDPATYRPWPEPKVDRWALLWRKLRRVWTWCGARATKLRSKGARRYLKALLLIQRVLACYIIRLSVPRR